VSIELHIERLVIDEALLAGERPVAVRQAIERELGRRLASAGTAEALSCLGSVAMLPSAALPPVSPRDSFGVRIASAVQQSLGIHAGGGARGHG
jgi:hypothetical protein